VIRVDPSLYKSTPWGLAWSRTRVKAAAAPVFEDLEACTCPTELGALPYAHRAILSVLQRAVPDWYRNFWDRLREREEELMAEPIPPRFPAAPAAPAKPAAPARPAGTTFSRAKRSIKSLLIGLGADLGGGKTYSALALASGLARGGPIAMIDTENGRGLMYADRFVYEHGTLAAPFSPHRYRAAIHEATKLRPAVIVVDNATFEHTGTGGMLDMVGDGGFGGWKAPKAMNHDLCTQLQALPCHVILTFRVKEKLRPEKVANKWEVVSDGYLPQGDTDLLGTMTVLLELGDGGVPIAPKKRPWKLPAGLDSLVPFDRPLDAETGLALANWCEDGASWDAVSPGANPAPITTTED